MRRLEVLEEAHQRVPEPRPLVVFPDAWNRRDVRESILNRIPDASCRCPEDHGHDNPV